MSMPAPRPMPSMQPEGNFQTLPQMPKMNSDPMMPVPGVGPTSTIPEIKPPNAQSNMFKMQRNRSKFFIDFF